MESQEHLHLHLPPAPATLGELISFWEKCGDPSLQEGVFGQPDPAIQLSWLLMMRNCQLVRAGWVWGDWVFKAGG